MAPVSARPQTLRLMAKIPPAIAIRPSIIPTGLLPTLISSLERYHTINTPLIMLNIPAAIGFQVFMVFQLPRPAWPDAVHGDPRTTQDHDQDHRRHGTYPPWRAYETPQPCPNRSDREVASASARRLNCPGRLRPQSHQRDDRASHHRRNKHRAGSVRARQEEHPRVVTVTHGQTIMIPAGHRFCRQDASSATDFPS